MRRTTSALTTAALGGVLTASIVWAQQTSFAGDPPRSGTSALDGGVAETGMESDPLSGIPAHRGARYLMRNGLDYLKYQQYERALAFLREAENRQKELNESEKRALKQGIERARQGLRVAANAESPYALSEQSRRRNGFVPARSEAREPTDAAKTASTPAGTKAKRRPMRSSAADLELTRADAEEPIRLTSSEVTTSPALSEPEPASAISPTTGRSVKLPQIPKFTEVPASPDGSSDSAQGNVREAPREPAPLALAMARPPAELPPATMPVMEASPAPTSIQANQNVPTAGAAPATAVPVADPTQPATKPASATGPNANASAEPPLLVLDNEPPAAGTSVVKNPAPPMNRPDASLKASAQPSPLLLLPVASSVQPAPEVSSQPPATAGVSEGLALSAPPASMEPPATVTAAPAGAAAPVDAAEPAATPAALTTDAAKPMPIITRAAPLDLTVTEASPEATAAASSTDSASSAPLITKPAVVSIETQALAGSAPTPVDMTTKSNATSPDRAADAGAMRVANAPPVAVEASAADGLPPLPDELSRPADSPPVQTTPEVANSASGALPVQTAPVETASSLDDALPPLPIELGRPSPIPAERAISPMETPATITAMPNSALPNAVHSESAVAAEAAPSIADHNQTTATATPVPTDAASLPDLPPSPASAVRSESAGSTTSSAPTTAAETSAIAVSMPDAQPQSNSVAPMSAPATIPTTDATSVPVTGSSPAAPAHVGDPFMPDRRMEGSNLKPQLIREVEEVARKMEDELHNQVAAPAPQPPNVNVRDTSPTDLKTQFQLDISRAPSPAEARPIKAIPVPEDWVPLGQRNWAPQRKFWAAAATCHLPLYFQDPMLERYGHNVEQFTGPIARYLSYPVDDPRQSTQNNQVIQPFFSAGLMALQIVALPYNLVMDPPWEAQYDLGYYRPGDVIPTDTYWLPLHGYGPPLRGNRY